MAHVRSEAYLGLEDYDQVIRAGEQAELNFNNSRNKRLQLLHFTCLKINQIRARLALKNFQGVKQESNNLVKRLVDIDDPDIQALVALTHILHAEAEYELGKIENSIVLLEGIVARYGEYDVVPCKYPYRLLYFARESY